MGPPQEYVTSSACRKSPVDFFDRLSNSHNFFKVMGVGLIEHERNP